MSQYYSGLQLYGLSPDGLNLSSLIQYICRPFHPYPYLFSPPVRQILTSSGRPPTSVSPVSTSQEHRIQPSRTPDSFSPVSSSRCKSLPLVKFTQSELDQTLYGYSTHLTSNDRVVEPSRKVQCSREESKQLSYGIDRILQRDEHQEQVEPTELLTLQLPEGLKLYKSNLAGKWSLGVFSIRPTITRGTRYGPFRGKLVRIGDLNCHEDNSFAWEIFANGSVSHFLDGCPSSTGETISNNGGCQMEGGCQLEGGCPLEGAFSWMAFVRCARYPTEQNMAAIQLDGEIYYETTTDILYGSELLVWYGDAYLQFMGIPLTIESTSPVREMEDGEGHKEDNTSDGFQCERCGKVFAYKYYRDKHLKYTRCVDQGDRKFPCQLCNRSFEKRDRLRIHVLHVHEKHRPHKCNMCTKSFSQSSSLNKHMRVHSGERPYKCPFCSKAFTASSILRTHIRQHSGEKPFKCKHCGKAFASHAAHDSHVRRTHTEHQDGGPYSCKTCGRNDFTNPTDLRLHNCATVQEKSVPTARQLNMELILPSSLSSNFKFSK